MSCFSPRRFAYTLRYLGFVQWRSFVNWVFAPFLVTCAAILLLRYVMDLSGFSATSTKGVFCFALMVCSSFCCVKVLSPGGRPGDEFSQFLALPASMLEKFIAAIMTRVVMPLLCITVGYYAAVLVTSPSEFLTVLSVASFSVNGVPMFNVVPPEAGASMLIGFCLLPMLSMLCSLSFFLLSGFLFVRFKWIMGNILQTILVLLVFRCILSLDELIDFDEYEVNFEALVWWGDAILFLVSSLLVFLSYKLWTRSQSVSGRFLSV